MGPDNKRILLATVVSMAILFGFQLLFPSKPAPKKAPAPAPAATEPANPSQPAAPSTAATPAVPVPEAAEELVVLESPELKATFSSHGGALKSLVLKGDKFRRQEKGKDPSPVDLVRVAPGEALPLAVVPSTDAGSPLADPAARASMRIAARDDRSVTFEGTVGGARITKRFSLTGKAYELAVELKADGPGPSALALVYPAYVPHDQPKPGFFSGGEVFETVVPVCRVPGKTWRMGDEAKTVEGSPKWAGLDQHYFVSALVPQGEGATCAFAKGASAGTVGSVLRFPYGGALEAKLLLFSGPKQLDLLQAYGKELDAAIDYGAITNFFAFFARLLLWILRQAYALVHNWGAAIILLTLLVKAVLYPLTAKSMQSMNEMRKLQPEIEKLKAKYGDDREKMNLAVMQLYQQHKVNPLGGCLPLLLQMPIFFALYATLQTSVELYREPFLWISDLTRYDPLYVLPIARGVSQFVMQKLSPQPADNAQAKMMLYFMPIFFTVIMFRLPAGLALYIFANNLISMAQQQWLMRRSTAAEKPAAA